LVPYPQHHRCFEHKVKHIPIGGFLQFCVTLLFIGSLAWGTFSTSGYFTARATVKAQNQTLRSVVSDRADNMLGSILKPGAVGPVKTRPNAFTLSDRMLAISSSDPKALYAHIARLEQEVTDLRTSNEVIVQRVKEKNRRRHREPRIHHQPDRPQLGRFEKAAGQEQACANNLQRFRRRSVYSRGNGYADQGRSRRTFFQSG